MGATPVTSGNDVFIHKPNRSSLLVYPYAASQTSTTTRPLYGYLYGIKVISLVSTESQD